MMKTLVSKCSRLCSASVLTVLLLSGGAAWAQSQATRLSSETIASYISEIGFLRAAPQLAARGYLQMALNVEAKRATEAIALAGKGGREGVGLARQVLGNDRDGLAALDAYQRELEALLAITAGQAERSRAKEVSDAADRSTQAGQRVVDFVLARLGVDTPRVVASAGLQRVISLRLAKLELLMGLGVAVNAADIAAQRNAFNENLAQLTGSQLTTERIKAEIGLARMQWMFMEKAIAGDIRGPQAQRDVVIASDNVLRTMNTLTGMYEQELVKRVATRPAAGGRVS